MPASEQGVNLARYMLVPRTLIFLTRGDKLLLLKGSHDKRLWAELYNGIGGHVEQGEDLLSAARRELLEETGTNSADLWLCGISIVNTQINPGVCIFIFRGECQQADLLPSKEGTLDWIATSEVTQLPVVPDLPLLLPNIINSKYGDAPFLAYVYYDENGKMQVEIG